MDSRGRPDHIMDALAQMHQGGWYGWKKTDDNGNKISNAHRMQYKHLVIHPKMWNSEKQALEDNPYSKPTESEVNAKLKELQDAWDLNYGATSYKNKRRGEYPKIPEQLDKLYHDMTAGKLDSTGEWYKAVKAVKDKYAKV